MLEQLIDKWGYLAVAVGTFLEGETVLVIAGALAHRGLLSLPAVTAAAFAGSVAGDQLWFHVGRRFGRAFIAKRPHWRERADRTEAWFRKRGSMFVVGFRFVYGFRTAAPLCLGASGYPPRRFLALNVLGGALWAVVFAGGGWALGASLKAMLNRASRIEEVAAVAVGFALLLWIVSRRRLSAASRPG